MKKEALAQMLSSEFCEIYRKSHFTEHVWATPSTFFIDNSLFEYANYFHNYQHVISDNDNYCNWTRTQNHLVLKRTLNHLAKLLKLLKLTLIKSSRCFGIAKKATTLQMHHMYSTLKRRGKDV